MSESLHVLGKLLHWLKELIFRLRTYPVPFIVGGAALQYFLQVCASQVLQFDQWIHVIIQLKNPNKTKQEAL